MIPTRFSSSSPRRALSRALRQPAFAIGVAIIALAGIGLLTGPTFGQGAIFEIITKIIQEQQELAEQRRAQIAAVKRMQFGLKELGYYDGEIDGDFGPETAAALAAYRRSIGRSNSGLLSIDEITEIESRAGEQLAGPPQPQQPSTPAEQISRDKFIRADTAPRLNAKLPDAAAWIIIASRTTPEEAKEVAEPYLHWFPSTTVTHSSNGVYAISIGWLDKDRGRPLKDALISKNLIPPDSFLSSGEKLEPPIWSVDGHRIHSRNDLLLYALIRATSELMGALPKAGSSGFVSFNSQVSGLTDPTTDFLSLRTGSSTSSKELRRLPEATRLKILRTEGEWQRIELLNGMTGWVSARYVSRDIRGPEREPEPPVPSPDKRKRDKQMVENATAFLDDLVVYLKLHPETPDIASIAQEVSELQQAVRDEDIPSIEATITKLKSGMEAIAQFPEFVRDREKERTNRKIEELGKATALASRHKQFLRKQIAKNIMSPNTRDLALFLKEYESALRSPDLSTVTDLNDRLKKFVSENGLQDDYDEAMAEAERGMEQKSDVDHEGENSAERPIIETERNCFLMKGELTDWVLTFNSSGKAPHVARNIRGDIVFERQQADVCVLHPPAEKIDVVTVEDILSEYKVDTVRLDPSECSESSLQSHDVLIANRGEFLRQPRSYVAPLLGLIEDGTFEELKTLSGHEFEKFEKFCELEAAEIESKIETGVDGFGLIRIDNGSANICVTTAEQEDAHRALLNDQRRKLLRCFNAAPEIRRTNVEAGFIAAKHGECGAIYARRSDLSDVITSFRRDKISISVLPVWFEPNVVADRDDRIRRENEILARKEEDRRKELELKRRQIQEDTKRKGAREADLRAQHGAQARALAEEITRGIKLLVDHEKALVDWEFPDLANWYRGQTAEGWEFVGLDYEIADYGNAVWQGRTLEAILTDVTIQMKNRLLGERKNYCFRLGLISDAEFQMYREPFEAECENAPEPTRAWKDFRSLWLAE